MNSADNTTCARIAVAQHGARMAAYGAKNPWRAYLCELSRQLAILFPAD